MAATNGFAGHPLTGPYATSIAPAANVLVDAYGMPITPTTNDPAWQPPTDPLKNPKATARVIHREVPVVSTTTSWTVSDVRAALQALVIGLFDGPAQLVDAIQGDSRVQAAMSSRTGGLLGRPVEFTVPRKYADSALAKESRDAFEDAWPSIGGERVFSEVERWGIGLGFSPGQLLWTTDGEYTTPVLSPWHPRYTYWHWLIRRFIAITMDGQTAITPGDGHWFLHAPFGEYRGWMCAAVRAIAPWWLARNYALRDWARYSERHGMPIIKAITPAEADPPDVDRFRNELAQLGQESVVQLPQGVDGDRKTSFDITYLEASTVNSETFAQLISKCDAEITLALMSQNLTTEVKEGSFAAARVHADVRQSLLEADARALGRTIQLQIARPFAALNFGNPDLAPVVTWNVKPYEDDLTAAQTFVAFATAIKSLKESGFSVDKIDALARRFGIDMGPATFVSVPAPAAPGAAGRGAPPSAADGEDDDDEENEAA
jgi:hypothetical protein